MSDLFPVEIITPSRKLVETEASEVVVPTATGEIGSLANHQDYIELLGTGSLTITSPDGEELLIVSAGVVEVKDGKLTVLAKVGEMPDEIDIELASKRKEELGALLEKLGEFDDNYARIKQDYNTELARIKAASN